MTRGETTQTKVHYKGKEDDFIIFLDDVAEYQKWKAEESKSIPLAQFVSSFNIFVTHKQGTQGKLDKASQSTLDNEFGTHVDEDVIKIILEKGNAQESTMPERQGSKNDSMGPMAAH